MDSHLRGAGPPALVSHAEAAEALSFGHLVLPAALVLPTGHCAAGFLLQLRQMLHAGVHLRAFRETECSFELTAARGNAAVGWRCYLHIGYCHHSQPWCN